MGAKASKPEQGLMDALVGKVGRIVAGESKPRRPASKAKAKAKAVSYLRCSGLGQVGGDTWDRQQAAITKYAKAHGLELADEFRDAGISGTKDLENRPGLAALLDRVRIQRGQDRPG